LSLFRHTKKFHNLEAIKCQLPRCPKFFKTQGQMKEHFEISHTNKCKICHLTFTNTKCLTSHLINCHREKKCKFYPCKFYTDSKEEMKLHLKEQHDRKSFDCVYCDESFTYGQNRKKHINNFHPLVAIKCDFLKCGLYFKKQADLEKHIKVEKHAQPLI